MLFRVAAIALALLVACPAFAIKGTFDSTGPMSGGAERSYSPDDVWRLPETLFNPVVFAAAKAGVTISAVPKSDLTVRLRYGTAPSTYGTTVTRCYKARINSGVAVDADGVCNVSALDRVDFVLCDGGTTNCLAEDTRYYYILEELVGSTWAARPEASFLTLDTDTTAVQRGAFTADEHFWLLHTTSCGKDVTADSFFRFQRGLQTQQNIITKAFSRGYRFIASLGDLFQSHHNAGYDDPCHVQEGQGAGGCGGLTVCTTTNINSTQTQAEADKKVLLTMAHMQPYLRYLPFVWTAGNHDPWGSYAEDHGTAVNSSDNSHWYVDASNNLNLSTLVAVRRYLPNPDFTYGSTGGAGDSDGKWFSFAMGGAEIIVGCAECGRGEDTVPVGDLDLDGTAWEYTDDFPGNVNQADDWDPSNSQSTFLSGNTTLTGTTGRLGLTSWDPGTGDAAITISHKFLLRHHNFGTNAQVSSGKLYGRGSMGAVERVCSGDASTLCSTTSDCVIAGGTCPDYVGTENLNGSEDLAFAALEAFIASSGVTACFFNGHDHVGLAGEKNDGGGGTDICYVVVPVPDGDQSGPGWADAGQFEASSDWGGNTNSIDGIPDYCDADSVANTVVNSNNVGACSGTDVGGKGSLASGFVELEVNGTTGITIVHIATGIPNDVEIGILGPDNLEEVWSLSLP